MAFLAGILQALLKAAFVGIAAFGGIVLGKKLRDRKDSEQLTDKHK